jgi:hypothetical protein
MSDRALAILHNLVDLYGEDAVHNALDDLVMRHSLEEEMRDKQAEQAKRVDARAPYFLG